MGPIALCCYPNVNGSVSNLSLNTSTAPFSCNSIISEKIFGLSFRLSFTFCTQNFTSNHAFFLPFSFKPPKFLDELNRSSKTAPANIWAHKNWKQIFGYFKLRFHNELLHWEKNHFLVFFRAGLHLHVRKISMFSVKQFKFFAIISYILDN